jgi:hypothetical protein
MYCAATIIIESRFIAAFVAQPTEEIATCMHKLKQRARLPTPPVANKSALLVYSVTHKFNADCTFVSTAQVRDIAVTASAHAQGESF